jgi:hypothetical protein
MLNPKNRAQFYNDLSQQREADMAAFPQKQE